MWLSNSSLSSLSSNMQKELPPVPLNSVTRSAEEDHNQILQAKSLKRKNFKKLCLDPASVGKSGQGENGNRLLGIGSQGRDNNFQGSKEQKATEGVTKSENSGDVNAEIRHSTNLLMNHFNDMKLSKLPDSNSEIGKRKRQTVVSSISPTKSSESSPITKQGIGTNTVTITDDYSPLATTTSLQLNDKDLLTLKNLGSGNSGSVSKILHIPTERTMAKKITHIDLKSVVQTQIIRELRILHECRSPYIIEFYGASVNPNNTVIICMEYCNCGSLDKIVQLYQPNQFPLFVLKKLTFSILSGLDYLNRTHKILHRDIKPNNVLMSHKGDFKLCDFGVLRELTNSLAVADTFVGTSTYMSPERIQGLNYGIKSDVWSIGLMLIELATAKPVWVEEGEESGPQGPEGILDLLQRIVNEPPPTLTGKVNPKSGRPYDKLFCNFIDSCLVKDDRNRKSPGDFLEGHHPFLTGVAEGIYDRDVKNWAKVIRKLYKEKNES